MFNFAIFLIIKIFNQILDEKLPSIFTNIRNKNTRNKQKNILSWIKHYRDSGKICGKDQNDHEPQIEFRNFPDEEIETARVGHLVSIISVTDLDLEDRGRSKVSIIAGDPDKHFTVDSVGDIHVIRVAGRGQLDRETTSQYQLTVQAEDRGTPPRTSTATLTVNVRGKRYNFYLSV